MASFNTPPHDPFKALASNRSQMEKRSPFSAPPAHSRSRVGPGGLSPAPMAQIPESSTDVGPQPLSTAVAQPPMMAADVGRRKRSFNFQDSLSNYYNRLGINRPEEKRLSFGEPVQPLEETAVLSSSAGGYDLDFTTPVPNDLYCFLCKYVCRDAMEDVHGHIACQTCLLDTARRGLPCPLSGGLLKREQCRPSQFVRRKVNELKAHCPNDGCEVVVLLAQMEQHLRVECKAETECAICHDTIDASAEGAHMEFAASRHINLLFTMVVALSRRVQELEAAQQNANSPRHSWTEPEQSNEPPQTWGKKA